MSVTYPCPQGRPHEHYQGVSYTCGVKPQPKQAHACRFDMPSAGYGGAINECDEDPCGHFWVSNGEYSSQVAYCPSCGAKVPTAPGRPCEWAT